MDELKQKLGLVPQITTEETFGDYSYYEFNDVDILNGTRKKRVNILIEMHETRKWYFVTKIVLTYCEKKLF